MSGWRAVKTIPGSAGFGVHFVASLVALVSSALPALLVALVENAFDLARYDPSGSWATGVIPTPEEQEIWRWFDDVSWTSVLALFLSPFGLALGIPFALWALRRGRAGWPVACLAGGTIALIIAVAVATLMWMVASSSGEPVEEGFGDVLVGVALSFPIGVIPGFAYWRVLRSLAPDLFEPESSVAAEGEYWT